jgi:ssRNA-specific RNase YbeY (16S rRNA maturation enzyme)
MVHGILHLCGYKDKKTEEKRTMKIKEEEALTLFNTQFN